MTFTLLPQQPHQPRRLARCDVCKAEVVNDWRSKSGHECLLLRGPDLCDTCGAKFDGRGVSTMCGACRIRMHKTAVGLARATTDPRAERMLVRLLADIDVPFDEGV